MGRFLLMGAGTAHSASWPRVRDGELSQRLKQKLQSVPNRFIFTEQYRERWFVIHPSSCWARSTSGWGLGHAVESKCVLEPAEFETEHGEKYVGPEVHHQDACVPTRFQDSLLIRVFKNFSG